MNRRESLCALFAVAATGLPFASPGQQTGRTWRVGLFMSRSSGGAKASENAFLAGMRDHGYEIGRNLIFDVRYASADPTGYAAIADELIALKPDVLVVSSTGNAVVLKNRTSAIPIVLGSVADPVGAGLVKSLARPGGNITGNALQTVELGAKQIELMTETLPDMRRVAVLTDLLQVKATRDEYEKIARAAAGVKGLSLVVHRVDGRETVRKILRDPAAVQADALLVNPSPALNGLRAEICRGAARIGLPAVGFSEEWAQDGALMAFGPSWPEAYRRAAYFVDRILKGAKASDLPMEQPTKFSLVVNAKTAKALKIRIPGAILLRADRVIE